MKKLLIISLLFIGILSFAQIRFGAKLAGQRSNIKNIHSSSESRIGYEFGGFALIPIDYSDQLFLQAELVFSALGENNEPLNQTNQEIKLGYIQVPVLLKAFFNEQDSQFFGELGPIIGFKIFDDISDFGEAASNAESLNSFDLQIAGGIGYSFNRKVELWTRLAYGVVDIYESDPGDGFNLNASFKIGISYIFN